MYPHLIISAILSSPILAVQNEAKYHISLKSKKLELKITSANNSC